MKQIIYQARNYPIDSCWVLKDWREQGISPAVVVRRQPNGNIVFGTFLVDFWCLGVKDAFCNADIPPSEFHHEYLSKMFSDRPMQISPALAHEMIYGSIDFAARYGFRAHRDFKLTSYVLDPPEVHPRTGAVEFGKDGEPFYVAGPCADVEAVMRKLMAAGGGRMPQHLIPIDPDAEEWFDDEAEYEVEEAEDNEGDEEQQDAGERSGSDAGFFSRLRAFGKRRSYS